MLHQKKVGRTVTHRSRKLTIRDGVKLLRAKPWSHWTVNVFWLFLQTFCPCSFRLWMGFGSERSGKNNSPLRWEKKKIMCMCFYKWNGLFLSLGAISSQRERWVGHHRKFFLCKQKCDGPEQHGTAQFTVFMSFPLELLSVWSMRRYEPVVSSLFVILLVCSRIAAVRWLWVQFIEIKHKFS